MTTAENSEHKKTEHRGGVEHTHTSLHSESKKFFWQHKHFFHHVFINFVMILVVLGIIFAWLPLIGPQIEKYLFPSSRLIEGLTLKVDELQRNLVQVQGQLSELPPLKQQVNTLSEAVNGISTNINEINEKIARIKQASTQPHLLQEPWEIIQSRFQKGEAFSNVLHTLIPKVGADKQLLETLHQLTVPANTTSKPSAVLMQELQILHDELKKSKETGSPIVMGETWLQRLLNKIYALVHIRKMNEEVEVKYGQDDLQSLLDSLAAAIKQLNSQQLSGALEIIRPLEGKCKSLLSGWLQEAEKRKNLEDAFNLFKVRFEAFVSRS
jgi:hypothetical protein